jgi:uncharacterized membrane protein
LQKLATPLGGCSAAYAVDGRGVVVVGYIDRDCTRKAYEPTSWSGLSPQMSLTSDSGIARAVNAEGTVIAGTLFINGLQLPAYWANNSSKANRPDNAKGGVAVAISADGSTIVGYTNTTTPAQAFKWTVQSNRFELFGGTDSSNNGAGALSVSADGSVVVGYSTDVGSAVRWAAGSAAQSLGFPGYAYGVSADGSAAAGYAQDGSTFIWDASHGARALPSLLPDTSLKGWTLTTIRGLSGDRMTVAGTGIHNGTSEGWIAHL